MFRGSIVALVTPLLQDQVDRQALCELVEFHISAGTHAIVAAGTTGESGTLSREEKLLVIKTVVKQARERIPVIAGTAMNATKDCIELTQMAMEQGAHAALIMTPAYIKPTQEGLYQHYSAIAQSVAMPLILYNIPGRTACDLLPATVARLAKISNIIGIKEATGQLSRLQQIQDTCQKCIDVYSGDDATAVEWMLAGAKGVISVTANVAPRQMRVLCEAALAKQHETCQQLNEQLAALHQHLFIESNPIPVKWFLSRMGLLTNELRLPLTPLTKDYEPVLETLIAKLQLN
jgi:4-hydroxy-tetrahydrodipicolinate synthase